MKDEIDNYTLVEWIPRGKHDKVVAEIYDDPNHLPFWIENYPSDKEELIVKVYKGSKLSRQYSAPVYYLDHFHELLKKEGWHVVDEEWVMDDNKQN